MDSDNKIMLTWHTLIVVGQLILIILANNNQKSFAFGQQQQDYPTTLADRAQFSKTPVEFERKLDAFNQLQSNGRARGHQSRDQFDQELGASNNNNLMSTAESQEQSMEAISRRTNERIKAALRRFIMGYTMRPQLQFRAPTELEQDDEMLQFQKKADQTSTTREIESLVESAIESANKFTRDPSKQQEVRLETSANSLGSSGHKTIRTDQPIYMRLPPRFGKRAHKFW